MHIFNNLQVCEIIWNILLPKSHRFTEYSLSRREEHRRNELFSHVKDTLGLIEDNYFYIFIVMENILFWCLLHIILFYFLLISNHKQDVLKIYDLDHWSRGDTNGRPMSRICCVNSFLFIIILFKSFPLPLLKCIRITPLRFKLFSF